MIVRCKLKNGEVQTLNNVPEGVEFVRVPIRVNPNKYPPQWQAIVCLKASKDRDGVPVFEEEVGQR